MMHSPAIAQQLAAEHQRDMLTRASRDRLARAARAARPARPATAPRTGPYLLRRVRAALTQSLIPTQSSLQHSSLQGTEDERRQTDGPRPPGGRGLRFDAHPERSSSATDSTSTGTWRTPSA